MGLPLLFGSSQLVQWLAHVPISHRSSSFSVPFPDEQNRALGDEGSGLAWQPWGVSRCHGGFIHLPVDSDQPSLKLCSLSSFHAFLGSPWSPTKGCSYSSTTPFGFWSQLTSKGVPDTVCQLVVSSALRPRVGLDAT